MSVNTILKTEKELDEEWLDLICEARDLGISIDEIRDFLQSS
ncbi:anti-repressor SinI family protein [Neobacillus bataviensis]|nr:anti-repressor SinI family protein [Neobacillus bataviensis]